MSVTDTATLVGVFEDGSPEWHEQRGQVIGSSDMGIILGLSTNKSARTLYHEKRGELKPEEPSPELQELYDYGHFMEPFIAERFRLRHPELPAPEKTGSWIRTDTPWMGCNPDRLIGDEPLELKTLQSKADWDEFGVPALYEVQLRHQMWVLGARRGVIAGWAARGGYGEWWFEADDFVAEVQLQAARNFTRMVDDGTPPEIDGSESTYRTLRRLNPSITPKQEVVVPEDIGEQYLAAMAGSAAAEREALRMKGHLLAHAGTAQYIFHGARKIARRQAKGDGVPYLVEA
jgi:putative phage-type endonuclease